MKGPSSKRPKIGLKDQLSLNAGQKYCRMLHSAILLTFIKLLFVIKIFAFKLTVFDWLFYTGFTVLSNTNEIHQRVSIIYSSINLNAKI